MMLKLDPVRSTTAPARPAAPKPTVGEVADRVAKDLDVDKDGAVNATDQDRLVGRITDKRLSTDDRVAAAANLGRSVGMAELAESPDGSTLSKERITAAVKLFDVDDDDHIDAAEGGRLESFTKAGSGGIVESAAAAIAANPSIPGAVAGAGAGAAATTAPKPAPRTGGAMRAV